MTSNLQFQKATKEQAKLRLALFGPSGAGKTYSALRIAKGMGAKVALIDSEGGSASKYADRFDFDVLDIGVKTIDVYIEAMKAAGDASYPILIIDSLSHAWKELLEEVDRLAKTKFKGNNWSAWSEGTPKQKKLVDALLNYDGHIVATIRSKTDWLVTTNDQGKNVPQRLGLAPEQGKGIEYEFDMLMELSTEHIAHVLKDRTSKYQDQYIEKPDESFGKELIAWLSEGVVKDRKTKVEYRELVTNIGIDDDEAKQVYDSFAGDFTKAFDHLSEQYADVLSGDFKNGGEEVDDVDVTEDQPEGEANEDAEAVPDAEIENEAEGEASVEADPNVKAEKAKA